MTERTTQKYGDRGIQYVHIEVGHTGQNILLEAVSSELGAVTVGGFDEGSVAQLLRLPSDHIPFMLISVGHLEGVVQ